MYKTASRNLQRRIEHAARLDQPRKLAGKKRAEAAKLKPYLKKWRRIAKGQKPA
jgi:hypothetical protein